FDSESLMVMALALGILSAATLMCSMAGKIVPFADTWLGRRPVLRLPRGSICRRPSFGSSRSFSHNSHAVERSVNEEERNQKERQRQSVAQSATCFQSQFHRKLHCQQAEQGCEFDHRIHR